MPSLKEVRNRIVSVNSTRQITSAMKMVSAAKLKKAQDNIIQLRPYAEKLSEIIANVSQTLEGNEGKYSVQREEKRVLYIMYTSNRGLCGAFNSQVIKKVKSEIEALPSHVDASVMAVGKKGYDFYRKTPFMVNADTLPQQANYLFDGIAFEQSAQVAEKVMESFANEKFDRVCLVYNKFKNAAVQETTVETFLPVVAEASGDSDVQSDYIFEPGKLEILDELIPKALKTQFHKALIDSNASEHGARMTAMHKATDNASELLKELKLTYNKARQAAITKEILEITSGAEALNG